MRFTISARTGATTAVCVLIFAGAASAGNQIGAQGLSRLAEPHKSSAIRMAENDKTDAHDHTGDDLKDHADSGGHTHQDGEAAHHGEDGHQHQEGDAHADHKDGDDGHEEHAE